MPAVSPNVYIAADDGGGSAQWTSADGGSSGGGSSGGGSSGGGGSSEPVDPNNAMYQLVLHYFNYQPAYVTVSPSMPPDTVDTVYAPIQDGVVNTAVLSDCPTSITAVYDGSTPCYLITYRVVEEGYTISDYDHVSVEYAGATVTKTWHGGRNGSTTIYCYATWATSGIIIYHPGTLSSYQKYRSKFKTAGEALTLLNGWFTRDGYIQNGWTKTDGGAKQYDFGDSYTPSDGAVEFMYPSWEEYTPPGDNFTITIHPNGATGEDIVLTVEEGGDVTIPDATTYSRDGYHLSVWNEAADGSGSSWLPGETYNFTRGDNVELYAIWAGDEYTVYYAEYRTSKNLLPSTKYQYSANGVMLGQDVIYQTESITLAAGTYTLSITHTITTTPRVYYRHNGTASLLGRLTVPGTDSFTFTEDAGTFSFYVYETTGVDADSISQFMLELGSTATAYEPYDIPYIHESKAVYGEPFYTDRVPYPDGKEYCTFDGWIADDNTVLTKADAWFEAYSYGSDPTWTLQRDMIIYPVWTPYWSAGKVFFGGMYSDDCSIRVEEPPSYIWPEYSYAHDKVYGRSGDILRDNGRYENVSKKYKVSVYDGTNFYNASKKISEWLHRKSSNMYMRLEDSYEPDIYMLAVYEESNELDNLLAKAGKGEITFNCKPQKFLLSGDVSIDITQSGQVITNPTSNPSFPIITFSGTGTVSINGKSITAADNFNIIEFHADSFNAFDNIGRNMNGYIYVMDSIVLEPGNNTIEYDGYISDLKITPRWWRV